MSTRAERQAQERKEWIARAISYMSYLEVVTEDETAYSLAESLWYNSRDEGGEMMYTPIEAVDEEISYWGE